MTPMSYLLQRGTAALMAPLVITHLVVIVLAVQGGLSADEILGRTRGSLFWGAFYSLFVVAAAIHAGIGLQTILHEWSPLGARGAAMVGHSFILIATLLGARAVYAVVWA